MFLDNYYDDIMDTDFTDLSICTNKVALYNKRVQDVERYMGIVMNMIILNYYTVIVLIMYVGLVLCHMMKH